MRKSIIIIIWLLIVMPAVLIGAYAFRLLRHEQERIEQSARILVQDRIQTTAESIRSRVESVSGDFVWRLKNLPPRTLRDELWNWRRNDPLVRNAFLWEPRPGLIFPAPNGALSREENMFILRYTSLFDQSLDWNDATPSNGDVHETRTDNQMARPPGKIAMKPKTGIAQDQSGCIPWFSENELFLLVWQRTRENAPVVGVELETAALMSRLIELLPQTGNAVFAILDGRGQVLHQTGGDATAADAKPIAQASIGPCLPHWQVAAFANSANSLLHDDGSFLLIASLIGGALLLAILTAGTLLLWQAVQARRDAQRKTSFVANVSHELKTPLTSIRMYSEMLAQNRVADAAKRGRYLKILVNETERLTRLVNNVLDFGRLEQKRRRYNIENIDAVELTRTVFDRFQEHLNRTEVQTSFVSEVEICECELDRDAFAQVLLNLLDNAVKYGNSGKIIEVVLRCSQTSCEIDVCDRGPGVPKPHRRRIFKRFHRVDDSLTADKPGSGLGLSIALKLMHGMGGDLRYSERPGGGACFKIIIQQGRSSAKF